MYTSSAGAVEKYCNEQVCVRVSVCPRAYLPNHTRDLYLIFVHVAYRPGSVVLWRGDGIPRGRKGQFWGSLPNWQCIVQHSILDPYKNGWTDRDAVSETTRMGRRNHVSHGVQKEQLSWVVRAIQKHFQSSVQRRCGVRCKRDHSIANNVMQQKG